MSDVQEPSNNHEITTNGEVTKVNLKELTEEKLAELSEEQIEEAKKEFSELKNEVADVGKVFTAYGAKVFQNKVAAIFTEIKGYVVVIKDFFKNWLDKPIQYIVYAIILAKLFNVV